MRGTRRGGEADVPLRQSKTPLVAVLAAIWAACLVQGAVFQDALSSSPALAFDPGMALSLGTAAVGGVLLLIVWRARGPVGFAALVLVAWTAGLLASHAAYAWQVQSAGSLSAGDSLALSVVVESDPRPLARGGYSFHATAAVPASSGTMSVVVYCQGRDSAFDQAPKMGSVVSVRGTWEPIDADDEYGRSQFCRGFSGSVEADRVECVGWQGGLVGAVRAARGRLIDAIAPQESAARALTAAVVCGYQASLKQWGLTDLFANLGLSHLVAVSGSHLGIVSALLLAALLRVGARPWARCAAGAAVLGAYVCLTGLQVSAIRSFVMCVTAALGFALGRRTQGLASMGAAGTGMLLVDPAAAWSLGLQLSVLSVAGIAVYARYAAAWVELFVPAAVPRALVEAASITAVCQMATLPISLTTFGVLPLFSVPANLVMAPLVSVVMVVGLAASAVGVAVAGLQGVVVLPVCVAEFGIWFCGLFDSLPLYAPVVSVGAPLLWGCCCVGAVALYAAWPVPSRRAALVGGAFACLVLGGMLLSWRFLAPARVVVLDVGQGDAILIQDGASAVLVDTGPDGEVVEALARQRCYHLDAVVLTHTDLDHAGGLGHLKGRVHVERVVVAAGVGEGAGFRDAGLAELSRTLTGSGPGEVLGGDALAIGGFELDVVWPDHAVSGDENEDSVVGVLSYRSGDAPLSVLLTGDAESQVVERLLDEGKVGRVDVLKVGHHGSAASTTPRMVQELDCVVAVASAGKNNRYGHPKPSCVAAVEGEGAAFLCTSRSGDVAILPDGGRV